MESLDALQKQVNKLQRLLDAQKSGLPARLVMVVTNREDASTEAIDRSICAKLSRYGLDSPELASEAGCQIVIALLPWIGGRSVGRVELEPEPSK